MPFPAIDRLAENLVEKEPGFWVSGADARVSYPEVGNQWCFEVEDVSYWFAHRNRCIVEVLRRFPPGGAVFDLGGGNGVVSKAILDAGFDAVLVEPGPTGARNGRRRGLPCVVQSTLEDAGFRPGALPAAGMFDVIEHIEDDVGFLRRLKNALSPSGRIYVTVPNHPLLWSEDDVYAGHFRRYTTRALRRTLHEAGFETEFVTSIFAALTPAVLVFRTIPYRLGIRSRMDLEKTKRDLLGPGGAVGAVLAASFRREAARIARGRIVPGGGSLLAVARAKP